ncbi:MAG: ribosome recycling factor [Candidatus Nealsonbacteria bacterium]|nr:ribosome recycling factor [Candidatus Nealsonbacteria bacterium]
MDYKEIVDKIKPELEKTFSFLERELAKIRTGRASSSLVEDVVVDLFGQKLPLKQLGSITSPEPRQIVVQPWDKSYLEPIEKALSQSGIGISPAVDKDLIRVNLPPLTEEFRKNLIKIISEKQEEAKRTIRKWREEAWKETQELSRGGKIREDDKFRAKDELQKLIDEYGKKIEEAGDKKRKEVES